MKDDGTLKKELENELKEIANEPDVSLMKTRDGAGPSNGHSSDPVSCFVAGTPITVEDGCKNIEDVVPGDKVLSFNEQTCETGYSETLQTFVHDVDEKMYRIRTEDDEVECTGIHKFYVDASGQKLWRPAEFLEIGDVLVLADGSFKKIVEISAERKKTKVYNIQVAGNHNYCVGKSRMLVHNKDCFVPGTKIATPNGLVGIETLNKGDSVLSYSESEKTMGVSEVVGTMSLLVDDLVYGISVQGEVLECTRRHPFLTRRAGQDVWTCAADLVEGDMLHSAANGLVRIDGIRVSRRTTRVHNIEVSSDHTYYVGKSEILVHNKGGGVTIYTRQVTVTTHYVSYDKNSHIFCGVPAWTSDEDGEEVLHFGQIPNMKSGDRWGFMNQNNEWQPDPDESSDWGRYLPGEDGKTSEEVGR
jgi:hypothetical protein